MYFIVLLGEDVNVNTIFYKHGLVPLKSALCKKKILRHIKFAIHAWSTKMWIKLKTNCTVWLYFARRMF
jgi:hypothetical protein